MIIKELFHFLMSDPNEIQTQKISLRQRIFSVVKILCLIYAVKLLFTAIQILLVKNRILQHINAADSTHTIITESGPTVFLLQFVLFGPILEELGFRAILQKGAFLTASGVSSMLLLLTVLLIHIPIYSITWTSILSIVMACLFCALLLNSPSILHNIMQIRNRHARAILWFNAIAFALWHFYNFDFAQSGVLTIAWYLTPHFFVALIWSWLSLKAGFFTACVAHICNNLLPAVFFLYANNI